jgi:Flp pilus assembly protein TadG
VSGVRRHRAQSLTEFALTVPMFVALMLVTFEAGRLMFTWSVLLEATREATRTAVLSSSTNTTPIVNSALNLGASMGIRAADVTVWQNGSQVSGTFSRQRGDQMAVSIAYSYTVFIARYVGVTWPGLSFLSLPFTLRTQMRAEG